MYKKSISLFFTVIFVAFIAMPSAIAYLDSSIDISIFYSLTEEEKGAEKIKSFKVVISDNQNQEPYHYSSRLVHNQRYYFKKYAKPHLNLISPPPEFQV